MTSTPAPGPPGPTATTIRWDVDPNVFPPEVEFRTAAAAQATVIKARRSVMEQIVLPLVMVLVMIAPAALGHPETTFGAIIAIFLFTALALIIKNIQLSTIGADLGSRPWSSTSTDVVADATGFRISNPWSDGWVTWHHVQSVIPNDDSVALVLWGYATHVFPFAAVTTGQSPADVVATIEGWVASANATEGPPGWTGSV
ncbi:MAG: hypothetical protein KF906_09590 [Actinobacteria bacterium]|nr:hypothetical protein [Actinomycetota bacterium]